MIATVVPPPNTTTNVSINNNNSHNKKSRVESVQDLKARLRNWGHNNNNNDDQDDSSSDSSDLESDFDDDKSQDLESQQRILELRERLREWEVLLNSKKSALSSSDHNKVQSIFDNKKSEEERRSGGKEDDDDASRKKREAYLKANMPPALEDHDGEDEETSGTTNLLLPQEGEGDYEFDTVLFEYDIPMDSGLDYENEEDYKHSSQQRGIQQQQRRRSSSGSKLSLGSSGSKNSRLSLSSNRSNSSTSNSMFEGDDDTTEMKKFDYDIAMKELGNKKGPMRFAPSKEQRPLELQLQSLSLENKQIYDRLCRKWKQHHHPRGARRSRGGGNGSGGGGDIFHLSKEWIMRIALNTSTCNKEVGSSDMMNEDLYLTDSTLVEFHERKTWKVMRKLKKRFVDLTIDDLESQLKTKTLFPVPGLKTLEGQSMFYMKPSRYFPKETSTKTIINNLAYVMTSILECNEYSNIEGIGFIANMDDWKMINFDINYCFQYMMCLQGFCVPVKVELFLIVNPPNWFSSIWKIMKPMLAPNFRRKVKVILNDKLPLYLQEDYQTYLPDDMSEGKANTTKLVDDFITFRKYYEQQQYKHTSNNNKKMKQSTSSILDDSFGSESGFDCSTRSSGDISICSIDIDESTRFGFDSSSVCSTSTSNLAISMTGEVIERNNGIKKFTPKLAMEKTTKVLSIPKDDDDDEEDDAVFDDDLSLFDETGW